MGIRDKVTRLEKQIERLAARRHVSREPLEIRRAVLEDVEEHAVPAGRSRRVLPFNRITVHVVAAGRAERAALEAVLAPDRLADGIREQLREAGCEIGGPVDVAVRFARKPGPHWGEGRRFHVEYDRGEAAPPAGRRAETRESVTRAQLVVLKGTATRRGYALAGACTNIGRLAEVTDRDDRVVRRNQVVFLESDDEVTRTVSRAQAHIRVAAPGEYRLHDDRSAHGTRIFREGRTIEIPSGSPRGVRLRTGDEIYFGQASVRFEEVPASPRRPAGRPRQDQREPVNESGSGPRAHGSRPGRGRDST